MSGHWQDRRDSCGYPVACARAGDELIVTFADIAADEFVDPFADWTIERQNPATWQRSFSGKDLAMLASEAQLPEGVIFHIARCGSTLTAQMIAKLPGLTVYSEPSVLNDLLYPHFGSASFCSIEIKAIMALLGSHAGRPYVIKCRSWHSLYAGQIAQSLCRVPWVFLYRNPLEVAVSVLRKPPTWLRSRALHPNPFHRFVDAPVSIEDEEYVARILGCFFSSIPTFYRCRGAVISYDSLPSAAIEVAMSFGLAVTPQAREDMLDRARYNSKGRTAVAELFRSDKNEKLNSASPALVSAIDTFTQPQLRKLLLAAGTLV